MILKYSADEARSLKAYKELPQNAKINETDLNAGDAEGDLGFEFNNDSESDEEGPGAQDINIDNI